MARNCCIVSTNSQSLGLDSNVKSAALRSLLASPKTHRLLVALFLYRYKSSERLNQDAPGAYISLAPRYLLRPWDPGHAFQVCSLTRSSFPFLAVVIFSISRAPILCTAAR